MKIIDLSTPLEHGIPSDPPGSIPKILYSDHKTTAAGMAASFKGCTVDDLGGNGWAVESIVLSTHSGTHLDAPYHFWPTQNGAFIPGGEKSWTIDQIPLEWCIGDGILMDFSDKPDGYKIMAADLEEYFARVGVMPQAGNIVLLHTNAKSRWGSKEYLRAGAGMSAEATHWLIDRGVHIVGTDGWSWDVPLPIESEEFAQNHDPSILWEAHRVGRDKAYCHIEKMNNLDQLPVSGFTVICLPISIKNASAGWTRAVAVMHENK